MRSPALALVVTSLLAPSPTTAAEFTVTMVGMEYRPTRITAAIGDTIRFVNDDPMDHDVFVPTAGHAVDLGKQGPGSEAVLVLGKAGNFDVECVFHSTMLTTVEVR